MHRALRVTGRVLLWVITVLETLGLGIPGAAKFGNAASWEQMFVGWGYPAWFSFVIGTIELTGAVCLLVPRLASYAALGLGVVMIAAFITLMTHHGSMGAWTPAVHVVLLSVIAAARWKGRWTPK